MRASLKLTIEVKKEKKKKIRKDSPISHFIISIIVIVFYIASFVPEFDRGKKISLNFGGELIRSCTTGNVEQKAKVCSGWRCVWIGVCGVVGFSRMGTRWPIQQWSIPVHVGKHSTAFGENWISNAWMVTERTAHYWLFPSWLFLVVVVVHEALYVELARIWAKEKKKKVWTGTGLFIIARIFLSFLIILI